MATAVYPEWPPQISQDQEDYLLASLKDWSMTHGLAVRPSPAFVPADIDPSGSLAVTAPVTLFPSPFRRACLENAQAIQRAYNELYAAIAQDEEWLGQVVQELIDVDDFIAKLWDVHLQVKGEGYVQDLSLGIFRSDYMVHVDPTDPSMVPSIKQVEFNTIASSFGGLAAQVSFLHKYLLTSTAYPQHPYLNLDSFPENPCITSIAQGLADTHRAYGQSKSTPKLPLCILFVVQPSERNVFDQRHIEYTLQQTHQIPTFRLIFSQTLDYSRIDNTNPLRPLIYQPPHLPSQPYEVSTLYFRAGYSPTDYLPPTTTWRARTHLERSAAIKCPSILTHLAGSKKIQQVLATPSSPHLARFIPDPATAASIRATFAAIYPLDTSAAGTAAKTLALDPHTCRNYVLKPQREGGGNNIYRDAIPPFLRSLPDEGHWRRYILMELIEPPMLRNSIFRDGRVETGEVVGELGVYGVCLWRHLGTRVVNVEREEGEEEAERAGGRGEILVNYEAGYLLRTKGRASEEGGVAAGFGSVDSVCLV